MCVVVVVVVVVVLLCRDERFSSQLESSQSVLRRRQNSGLDSVSRFFFLDVCASTAFTETRHSLHACHTVFDCNLVMRNVLF
jgi:hypothetical protein